MRKLRVMVLMHEDLVPPPNPDGTPPPPAVEWKTEYDVLTGLANLGHEVRAVGVQHELGKLRTAIEEFRPHIAFNLLEEFHSVPLYDQHVVSYLELLRQPYTGCNPRGLLLSRDKALSKKVLAYHRIPVPRFAVFPLGRKVRRPKPLTYPAFVKSLTAHSSAGIAQASIVHNDESLARRVAFIHEQVGTDAIAEQYIEGRELYVAILGNLRLQVLPTWELRFTNLPEGAPRIATQKVKWDVGYQQRAGIEIGPAADLDPALEARIVQACRRSYRLLGLTGYARMDLRLTEHGEFYLLEANSNADVAFGEELAESAQKAGLGYEQLLQRIVTLGLSYRPLWKV